MKVHGPQGLALEVRHILRRARQVWHLVPRRHKWALGGAALVMAVTSMCSTAMPLLLGRLVDGLRTAGRPDASPQQLLAGATWILALLGVVYVVREGLNVLRRYLVENTCTRVNRDMTVRLMSHVLKTDLGKLQQEHLGALSGRIFRSVDGFIRFLRVGFLDFLPAIITGVFALVAALSKQPLLGLAMAGVIPSAVYLTVRQLRSEKGVRLHLMRACEEINGSVVERLGGVEAIRAANTHDDEVRAIRRACEHRRRREIRHHFRMSLFGCAKALNEGLFHIIVLFTSVWLAVNRPDLVTYGDVLTFSILFLNVMAPLSEIHRILDEGHEASLCVGDLLDMLHEPVDRSFVVPEPRRPQAVPGAPLVAFDNVTVEYTTAEGLHRRGLDNVSLSIRAGETIGVAGKSGGGKSTWVKVLLRLTHPTSGSVLLGGVPLEAVTRDELARLIGYVSQTPYVFAGTVAENIAYGNHEATPEQIRRAAELAHLDQEIELMPGGYEAEVTERGQNLSGGQRQRLALARILLKQPSVLILDEATSALDNISERFVQEALEIKSPDRTTILVAHRLSTLRDADRIVVFDEGRIVEVGTFEELVRQGGVFAELVFSAQTPSPEEAKLAAAG